MPVKFSNICILTCGKFLHKQISADNIGSGQAGWKGNGCLTVETPGLLCLNSNINMNAKELHRETQCENQS
jgi:hypothetical protein